VDKIILIGNLGRNPEMRYMPNGKPVTNFSVASNRRWTDGENVAHEETIWVRVSAFGRLAEVCNKFLAKGRQVYVEGRLRPDRETGGPRVYQRRDGSYGASYEVVAATVQFLGSRDGNGASPNEPDFGGESETEEEIPF
jgi:single-strand DNA-binding protein